MHGQSRLTRGLLAAAPASAIPSPLELATLGSCAVAFTPTVQGPTHYCEAQETKSCENLCAAPRHHQQELGGSLLRFRLWPNLPMAAWIARFRS